MLKGREQQWNRADIGKSFEIIHLCFLPTVDSARMCISHNVLIFYVVKTFIKFL